MSGTRQAYLHALGVTPWVRRDVNDTGSEPPGGASADVQADVSGSVEAPPPAAVEPQPAPPAVETPAPKPDQEQVREAGGRRIGVIAGPGKGACLYLCGAGDDTEGALASDLARVLPEAPVWATLDEGGSADGATDGASPIRGEPLEALIAERLFTHVVVFGDAQANLVFGGAAPDRCGPARVTVVPDLGRLANDGRARRHCWFALKSSGCASRS